MQIQIDDRPSYAIAKVALDAGEEIVAEGGAMVAMTEGFELETKARGGFLKSIARSALGGESFFLNTFQAPGSGGTVQLAPALPGDGGSGFCPIPTEKRGDFVWPTLANP